GDNLKNPSVVAFAQGVIGHTYLLLDDHEQAWHYIRDTLDRAYRLGITRLIASCLLHLALIGCADAPVAAAEFVGHADALLARVGAVYEEAFRMIRDDVDQKCRAVLTAGDYDTHYRAGENATTRQMIDAIDQLAYAATVG